MRAKRFQILALDVDGTLLDPDGALRRRTLEAVARAARAGIRPVLCTGRRYRRAWPIARELGIDAPLVCNSGAIIKDPSTDRTIWRADFDSSLSAQVLNFAIGTRSDMLEFQAAAHGKMAGRIQTFVQRSPKYRGTMCEILRHDAGKWAATLHLSRRWQIDSSGICAVGDDVNDIPMIRNAGLGVAMGHAVPEVLAAADLVTGGHDEDGVASLVENVLLQVRLSA
jgi:hydroxymethylpyrimidine pyrophosphatase-like HAD family hydrolase